MRTHGPRIHTPLLLGFLFASAFAARAFGTGPVTEPVIGANNLGMPVLFAEGIGLGGSDVQEDCGLAGAAGVFEALDTPTILDKISYWPQGGASTWQAGWYDGRETAGMVGTVAQSNAYPVTIVSWSDSVLTHSLARGSVVPVEVVLYGRDDDEPMNGFEMALLPNGAWATTGTVYSTPIRTIFSATARLVIQQIGGLHRGKLTWNDEIGEWAGLDAMSIVYSRGVWEEWEVFQSPVQGFRGRVAADGRLVYSFDWNLGTLASARASVKARWYRITFNLTPTSPWIPGASFSEKTNVTPPVSGSPMFTPVVVPSSGLTYVDVMVTN